MKIRRAHIDDLPQLVQLGQEYYAARNETSAVPLDLPSVSDSIERLLMSQNGVLLVATGEAGAPIGVIAATFSAHWLNANHTIAQELFCWTASTASGAVGLSLVSTLEGYATDHGCNVLNTIASPNSQLKMLNSFYARHGYIQQDISYSKKLELHGTI